MYIVPK